MKRPQIGDKLHGGIVQAIGITDGERWAMTIDKRGVVGLWPDEGWAWDDSKAPAPARPKLP